MKIAQEKNIQTASESEEDITTLLRLDRWGFVL